MFGQLEKRDRHLLEAMLIVMAIGIACLFYGIQAGKLVTLHLFFLPVVLSGFFLGRYLAGVLAVFCVLVVSVVTALDLTGFAVLASPITIGLAICIWSGALGLTALLVGTLSDERIAKMDELHQAYVGVVEVLSRYLQSANPKLKARSTRVAEMSQVVAEQMRLPTRQVDDIRIAALLNDIGKLEITTKVITKAVDTLETSGGESRQDTFHGSDLVHSLSSLLRGAIPLLLDMDGAMEDCLANAEGQSRAAVPIGAKIIRTVLAYDALAEGAADGCGIAPAEALAELRECDSGMYDDHVLSALQVIVSRRADSPVRQPVM